MTTILITGANRGIGLEFVTQYAADGAEIIACCRTPDTAQELKAVKGKVRILPLEVAEENSLAALKKTLGGMPVDIVINNAGVSGPREELRDALPMNAWLDVFAVNSIAPVAVALALRDNLKAGRDKKLVTITSALGSTEANEGGFQPYRASKAAVNNFMRGLSKGVGAGRHSFRYFPPRLGADRYGRRRCAHKAKRQRERFCARGSPN